MGDIHSGSQSAVEIMHTYASKVGSDFNLVIDFNVPTKVPNSYKGSSMMRANVRWRINELISRASAYETLVPSREEFLGFHHAIQILLQSLALHLDAEMALLYRTANPDGHQGWNRLFLHERVDQRSVQLAHEQLREEVTKLVPYMGGGTLMILGLSPRHYNYLGLAWFANLIVDRIRGYKALEFVTSGWKREDLDVLYSGQLPFPQVLNETFENWVGDQRGNPGVPVGDALHPSLTIEQFAFHIPRLISMAIVHPTIDELYEENMARFPSGQSNEQLALMDAAMSYMSAFSQARQDLIRCRNQKLAFQMKMPPDSDFASFKEALELWVDGVMRFRELSLVTQEFFISRSADLYVPLFRHETMISSDEVRNRRNAVAQRLIELWEARQERMFDIGLSPWQYSHFGLDRFAKRLAGLRENNRIPDYVYAAW
jgi:hypothetical protein